MAIFKLEDDRLKKLNIISLDKEKKLQQLLETNLMEALELRFLASEYVTTSGGRIDTVAVDANGAPVIIEYKRNKNDNVINQSLSYLKWLKTQKQAFFEKLIEDKLGKEAADRIKLDWNNPRVICVAESYNKFDTDTVEVIPLRIELFKYRYYEGDIFSLEPINTTEKFSIVEQSATSNIDSEIQEPTIEVLRSKASSAVQQLFDAFRERVMAIDEAVREKPTQFYVAYRMAGNFAEVHIGKNHLKIHLRPTDYNDPRHMVDQIPAGYNWTMDRRIYLNTMDDLDYVIGIVEQSYQNVL